MLSVGSFSAVLGKLVETQIPGPACNLMSSLAPGGFFFAPLFQSLVNLLRYCSASWFGFLVVRHVVS